MVLPSESGWHPLPGNALLAARALAYPKLRRSISTQDADAAVSWLRRDATMRPDPDGEPPNCSIDPAR